MDKEFFAYTFKILAPLILLMAWVLGVTWYLMPANGQKIVSPSVIERLPAVEKDLVQAKVIRTHAPLTKIELSNIQWEYKHMSKSEKIQVEAASAKIP